MRAGRRACGLLIAAAACKRAEPPPPPVAPPPTPPPAHVAAPDAPPAAIDLLRAVPITLRVSSTVANPAILPVHLADRNLATAWNSETGKLLGEWIEIDAPPGTLIAEIRMTAGFAATGPKGEDWFAMNYRITDVAVTSHGYSLATQQLDPADRGLQAIALRPPFVVPATGDGTLRVRIDDVVAGSHPAWRELAISELEVWGRPPPNTPPATAATPTVVLATHAPDPADPGDAFATACDDDDASDTRFWAAEKQRVAACRAMDTSEEGRQACEAEGPILKRCALQPFPVARWAPPWTGAVFQCEAIAMAPAPYMCRPVVRVGGATVAGPWFGNGSHQDDLMEAIPVEHAAIADVLPAPGPELVARYAGITLACTAEPACREIDPESIKLPW